MASSPIKYHGGKSYQADMIVRLMPTHRNYVEPYCGGASVLFAKDPANTSEIINDLNGNLMSFWAALRNDHTFKDFAYRVAMTEFGEDVFRTCMEVLHADTDLVSKAVAFFVVNRQSLSGRGAGFTSITVNRVRRGMNEQVSAWLSAVEGLPEVHDRLSRVMVLNRDALEVIRVTDTPDTLFYLDPPYPKETRASKETYGEFEMSSVDHIQLIDALTKVKGMFILSSYHNELYDKAAKKNGWKTHESEHPIHSAGGKKKRKAIECLYTNF